jgi:hypothetical protein
MNMSEHTQPEHKVFSEEARGHARAAREEFKKSFEGAIPAEAREHAKAARDEMRRSFEAMFPPGVSEHRREARREMLLAFRSLIDETLKRMDEKKA